MNSFWSIRSIISSTLVFLICLSFGLGNVQAVLGPVHVELNITGERLGSARANTVTAFKIYMRINEDIYSHDWVKIWFPIEEASDDWDDVCGEEFVIKGHDESPRFVPNEKYFEKYDNPEEKKVGKVYEVLDEHADTIFFYKCSDLCDGVEHCRLVEDPSGLGCWIMGTVLPALPIDNGDRFHMLYEYFKDALSYHYLPCSKGHSCPLLVQTEREMFIFIQNTLSR